jgi:hypothetical protein
VRAASCCFKAASTALTAWVGLAAIPSNSGCTMELAGNWNCKVGAELEDGAADPAAATPGLVGDGTMVSQVSTGSVVCYVRERDVMYGTVCWM